MSFKKTKIGLIPKDWEVKRLGEVIIGKFTNGYSPVSPQNETGKWVLTLSALTNGKINLNEKKPAPIYDEKLKKFKIQKGDFLISRSNTPDRVGFSGLVDKDVTNYYYPDLMIKFRVNQEIIKPYYLEYFLKSSQIIKYFRLSASGTSSSMVKINQKIIEKTPIAIPPLKEQEKIAKILSTWDRAIEIQEELIKEKEKLKTTLRQKLFDEAKSQKQKAKSEKWKEVKLGDICNIRKGKQLNKTTLSDNEQYPVINGGIEPSGYTNKYNSLENTITISEGGNSCGYVNFIQEKFWSGGHCYTLENIKLDKIFLYYYLKHEEPKIMKLRVGSGLPNIQKKDIENFKILAPKDKKEQQKIAKILLTADKEIELLKNELKELKSQKKALMQKLLTGKVRVRL